jgi:hypothetical protein
MADLFPQCARRLDCPAGCPGLLGIKHAGWLVANASRMQPQGSTTHERKIERATRGSHSTASHPRDRLPLRGADVSAVLGEFGYGREDIQLLVSSGAVGRTEWAMNAPS